MFKMADDEDEEVWDSWEDAVDSGAFDKKLEVEESKNNAKKVNSETQPIILQEDSTRTAYQPQLKILKRPNASDEVNNKAKTAENKQATYKSLEQREKEYAEARQRIFGSTQTEEQERPLHLLPKQESAEDNVIRQPKGPDGTSGFNLQR
ncbi:SUZ RNA-binding domain-containing-like [Ptychodera flava]|uniref:SUZ RNA-binding domain-containing-like n=1 Tax=Ptychodera flava TaxID=63121 RepID=UPI003969FC29